MTPPGRRAGPASALDALAAEVLRDVVPIDRWAVAVALETRGIRDADAVHRYGHRDVFALADEIHLRCRRLLADGAPLAGSSAPPATGRRPLWRQYLQGLLAALPMVVPLVAVLLGLGASGGFTDAHATALVLGMALSFVVAGGPMQAIGRLGSYYRGQGSDVLATRVAGGVLRVGLALAAALAWYGLNLALGLFPHETALASSLYSVTLAVLWLALAILHMLEHYGLILLSVAAWVATYVLLAAIGVPIVLAQGLGIAAAAVLALVAGVGRLLWRARGLDDGVVHARLPRGALLVRAAAPYLAFGALYFGFLFADRIVGWSAAAPPEYPLFFRRAYETGLSFALVSLVPTLALLHVTMHAFTARCAAAQRRFRPEERLAHNRSLERFYVGGLALVSGVAMTSVALTYVIARELGAAGLFGPTGTRAASGALGATQVLDAGVVAPFVFWWSALAYALLAWGLLNAGILFSLSRPAPVVWAIAAAGIGGSAVGFGLSRNLGYWYSAAGLAAGAFVFALASAAAVIHVLRRLDYHLYAAE